MQISLKLMLNGLIVLSLSISFGCLLGRLAAGFCGSFCIFAQIERRIIKVYKYK